MNPQMKATSAAKDAGKNQTTYTPEHKNTTMTQTSDLNKQSHS